MNNLAKPIILGALIIAIAIYLGAERIAFEVSVEGQWESCIKTYHNEALKKFLDFAGQDGAAAMCLKRMIGQLN